ncbi:MAG: VOC family protein [Anaerolineaceae bacterium]|nr:VOC family protein [Anaerolineaceae bacterium]
MGDPKSHYFRTVAMPTAASQPNNFHIQQIGQLAINVTQLKETVAFYRDVLQLPLIAEIDPPGLAFFQCGEVRLMLSVPTSAELRHPSSIVYFQVEDLDAAFAHLVSAGATIVREPSLMGVLGSRETWMAFFRDPSDNLLALMTEKDLPSS